MKIDVCSDLHGHYPDLPGGDLLIVGGDLTARDTFPEYCQCFSWIAKADYKKKIIIGGNHDNLLQTDDWFAKMTIDFEYLCDSGTEFEGLKIYGSPWTKTFEGMNPHCKAFTCDKEEELAEKWALIPDDIDILITHSPPKGILDWNFEGKQCGSESLLKKSRELKNLKLFCFGHIHEAYSMINTNQMLDSPLMNLTHSKPSSLPIIVNASHVNEFYQPVNEPIRVIL